jgi:hypothetical protein
MLDLRDLAGELIAREGRGSTPFGLYIVPAHAPAAELGREIERSVFMEYFGNSPELLQEEYQPYDEGSVFIVVLDHLLRQPAGAMRLLVPGTPSKSLHDIARVWDPDPTSVVARSCPTFDPERCWDIATLAVMPGYRRSSTAGLISLAMYQSVGVLSQEHGIDWLIAILDVVVLDLIQTLLRGAFTPFDRLEPRNYLDSPSSLPVFLDLVEQRRRIALVDPDLYERFTFGGGLDAAVSMPAVRDAHVLRPVAAG